MLCLYALIFFLLVSATPLIYTLSLHDALPICRSVYLQLRRVVDDVERSVRRSANAGWPRQRRQPRSEEHTSELQSRLHLVCRLLLEKKKYSDNYQSFTILLVSIFSDYCTSLIG